MEKWKPFFASTTGKMVITIVVAVFVYGLMALAASLGWMPLVILVFAVCAYFGWKVLDFITPNIFLIMPVGGWLVYYIIKGVVAFFIGFVVAPFRIGSMVSKNAAKTAEKK